MAVINFTITDTLNDKIKKVVKEKGFQSKAEFFRAAVFNYLSRESEPGVTGMTEDERFDLLTDRLAHLLKKRYAGKKLPSLEEQLKDV